MSRAALDHRLCWMDCETGGLYPHESDMIELCVASVDGFFHKKFKPLHPVHAEAAKVNGYTPEAWEKFEPISEADLNEISRIVSGKMPAGHNVAFDVSFILEAFKTARMKAPRMSHRKCDTQALAMPLYLQGIITNVSLAGCVEELGIGAQTFPHDALTDMKLSMDLYDRLVALYGLEK